MPMPNRNNNGDYRYAYQGQEVDPETGKEAFQLRLWDSRIGRWLTTDPYGQYSSPYLGMGNNPINGIDPDGGFFGWIKGTDGNVVYDKNVNSQLDANIMHGGGEYLGDTHYQNGRMFLSNGSIESLRGGATEYWLDAVVIDKKLIETYVDFSGVRSQGRWRVDGNLSIIQRFSDGSNNIVDSWSAVSGSRRLLPTPNGTDWQLSNFHFRDGRVNTQHGENSVQRIWQNDAMTRNGVGFSINITPDPLHGRTSLRIHPDGGATGSAGCLALNGGANRLTAFENAIRPLLATHGTLRLEVSGSYHGPNGGWSTPINNSNN